MRPHFSAFSFAGGGLALGALAAALLVPAAANASNTTSARVANLTSPHAAVAPAALESKPYARFGRIGNNAVDRFVIAGPTTHTIALSSLTVSATDGIAAVRIRAVQPTDGNCGSGHVVIVTGEDMSFVVPDNDTHSVEFPSPLIAKPAPGKKVCLIAHADTTYVPSSDATLTVSASGFLR
jgi:hypothetical protein